VCVGQKEIILHKIMKLLYCVVLLLIICSECRRRNQQAANDEPGRDFYKILEVKKGASQAQIKKQYRAMSRKFHPDKNKDPGAEEIFKDVVAAFECLSNEEKRKVYDQRGEAGLKEWEKNGQSGGGDPFDIFDMFNMGGRRQRRGGDGLAKGPDVHIKLTVSLRTLYLGDIIDFDYKRAVLCANWDECEIDDRECEGPGIRMSTRQLGPGFIQKVQQQDDRCIARGKRYNPNGCSACPDGATVTDVIPLTLEIEPGMKSGDTIKFEEVADEHVGHTPGDLIIELVQEKHTYFTRKNKDLQLKLTIPLVSALTGFEKEVEHVDGHTFVVSPKHVLNCNSVLRIPGEGMPVQNSNSKGDVVVTFDIQFPYQFTDKQKQQLRDIL